MTLKFPVITTPIDGKSDFLGEFRKIVTSNFNELIVVSPFVDVFIIENIIKRCIFKDRKLLIITRYKSVSLSLRQRENMDKAVKKIIEFERKDHDLKEKVSWRRNERLHAKFIIKDWELILFGSQNITQHGGLTKNYELGALIDNPDEVKKIKPFVDQILTGSKKFYPRS